jgi:hypothetical protein
LTVGGGGSELANELPNGICQMNLLNEFAERVGQHLALARRKMTTGY